MSSGRGCRASSVSSEESVDSGSLPVNRSPEVVVDSQPSPVASPPARPQPRAWAAAVRPAAAAAAVARPPQRAAEGGGLRSVVVRPTEAVPPPPNRIAPPGKGKGLLSVVVAPASRFRNLEQGQSSRQAHPPPPRSLPRRAANADDDGWETAGRPRPASAVARRATGWRNAGSVACGLILVAAARRLRVATAALMAFVSPNAVVRRSSAPLPQLSGGASWRRPVRPRR
ncbi:uncharacterized protein LOC127762659 [Oryza glaberrima]|uniref:uncharacterized protein LOC127762659 n=1 Tax=Oryza glaberrima TaxID=4538 RepID=UPI00224BFE90|nr:uncharacterized protein LOC127762659 [Oryza glaberrima]